MQTCSLICWRREPVPLQIRYNQPMWQWSTPPIHQNNKVTTCITLLQVNNTSHAVWLSRIDDHNEILEPSIKTGTVLAKTGLMESLRISVVIWSCQGLRVYLLHGYLKRVLLECVCLILLCFISFFVYELNQD